MHAQCAHLRMLELEPIGAQRRRFAVAPNSGEVGARRTELGDKLVVLRFPDVTRGMHPIEANEVPEAILPMHVESPTGGVHDIPPEMIVSEAPLTVVKRVDKVRQVVEGEHVHRRTQDERRAIDEAIEYELQVWRERRL